MIYSTFDDFEEGISDEVAFNFIVGTSAIKLTTHTRKKWHLMRCSCVCEAHVCARSLITKTSFSPIDWQSSCLHSPSMAQLALLTFLWHHISDQLLWLVGETFSHKVNAGVLTSRIFGNCTPSSRDQREDNANHGSDASVTPASREMILHWGGLYIYRSCEIRLVEQNLLWS